jgi:hypothetical protein
MNVDAQSILFLGKIVLVILEVLEETYIVL